MFRNSSRGIRWSLKSNGPVTSNCSIGVRSFKQHQKLDLGRAKIHHGGFEVGLELDALQLQAVEVHLRQVAGLEAGAVHVQLAIPIVQVLPGIL